MDQMEKEGEEEMEEMNEEKEKRRRYLRVLEFKLNGGERTEEEEEERGSKLEFFAHKHDFTKITIIEATNEDQGNNNHIIRCHNCNIRISSSDNDEAIIIGCLECKIYLHQHCAKKGLLLNIRHIFHPLHRLTFKSYSNSVVCSACDNEIKAGKFVFGCKSCTFNLCIACSLRQPNIKCQFHEHHLTFFSNKFADEICFICGYDCDSNDMLRLGCVYCGYNIHLHCFPSLPDTITHKCHIDPLTLTTDPDLIESDKGYDEFYCDACEKTRNRDHPVYYCAECSFVAHVNCVFSEVLTSIIFQESDASLAISAMLEISNIQQQMNFGDITGDKVMEREFFVNLRNEENPEIQLVEYYLANVIGDDVKSMEFFTKLKEEADKEIEETKYMFSDLAVLHKNIECLRKDATDTTLLIETTKVELECLNAELEKAEAHHAELLRLQR